MKPLTVVVLIGGALTGFLAISSFGDGGQPSRSPRAPSSSATPRSSASESPVQAGRRTPQLRQAGDNSGGADVGAPLTPVPDAADDHRAAAPTPRPTPDEFDYSPTRVLASLARDRSTEALCTEIADKRVLIEKIERLSGTLEDRPLPETLAGVLQDAWMGVSAAQEELDRRGVECGSKSSRRPHSPASGAKVVHADEPASTWRATTMDSE